MKIHKSKNEEECEVYAIAIYDDSDSSQKVCYFKESELLGLSAKKLSECIIVDPNLRKDFKYIYDEEQKASFFIWNHFRDLCHLSNLFDLETDDVEEFEEAIKYNDV